MKFEIIWSEFAENQLDEIYEYYEKEVNRRVAKKITKGIINEPKKLMNLSFIGQEEELLKERKTKYRYIIYTNYKIIYSVDTKNGFIKVADVFDTRQYPLKMKRTK
ncbi:type II toxin-antitoxin system RelE/ParE family toxin [Polaribacter sp. M15]